MLENKWHGVYEGKRRRNQLIMRYGGREKLNEEIFYVAKLKTALSILQEAKICWNEGQLIAWWCQMHSISSSFHFPPPQFPQ